jgi:F0F1-type ATP synthase assembly protein I
MPGQIRRSRLGQYSTAGLQFIIPFGLMVALGVWLDLKWRTLPGFTVLGGILGFAGGVARLRQLARSLRASQRDEDEAEGGDDSS